MGVMFGAVVASQEQHSLCVMEPVRYSKNLQSEERVKLLTTLSQNLNFRKLVKTGPVEYIAPETKEVITNHILDLKVIKFTSF